jgi:hypothetical protein
MPRWTTLPYVAVPAAMHGYEHANTTPEESCPVRSAMTIAWQTLRGGLSTLAHVFKDC